MIDSNKAFSGFSVRDIEQARNFYKNILGLKVSDGVMGLMELHVGNGNPIIVYPKENHQAASYTILNFPTDDIEKLVDELISKGVKMEHYSGFDQNEKGIAKGHGPSIAWFKDPSDNILSIIQTTD